MSKSLRNQKGYFLVVAVILILVIGVMGNLIAYLFANRAVISVGLSLGLKSFYNAESGLEIGSRLLTNPTLTGTVRRIACGSLTGTSTITNATLGGGTFTISTINSSPVFVRTTLASAITATSTTINASSMTGFAPSGRLTIDREYVDYAAISGTNFVGLTRGANGTLASAHAAGASVGQFQCSIEVDAGIPNLTSPKYQRTLRSNVQLEDIWAGGNSSGTNFIFSHFNRPTEMAWTAQTVAGGSNAANINAISMLSNGDAWAVANQVNNNLIFVRLSGTTWTVSPVSGGCSNQHLEGISMVSATSGFAVGARYRRTNCSSGNNRYTILMWNGTSWSRLTPSTSPSIPADNNNNQNLNDVSVIDSTGTGVANFGFAVGAAGRILRYNGATWTQVTSPTTQELNGVVVVSTTNAWAVGNGGVIIRWNGTSWSSVTSPTTQQLNRVAMLDTNADGSPEFGLAIANGGVILSYNGSTWSATNSGAPNLGGLVLINQRNAWVSGDGGTLLHWNGTSWSSVASGTTSSLYALAFVGGTKNVTSNWAQVFR